MRRRFRKRKPGIGRTWLEPCRHEINLTSRYALTSHSLHKKRILTDSFLFHEWLGLQDSNLRMTGPKPVALPLGEGPTMLKYYHKIRESSTKHDYVNIS